MLEFIGAAVVMFVACWIWIGGYVADFVIWLVSKFVTSNTNETNVAIGIGVIFGVLGLIIAFTTEDAGSVAGGGIVGIGAYIAARLPGKVLSKRAAQEAKRSKGQG